MSNQRDSWTEEKLGGPAIYPTHPIVMACMIMDRYATLAEASGRDDGKDYPRAPSDGFLPGSGCAVYAGLDFLKYAVTAPLDAADRHAECYWSSWEKQNPNNIAPGGLGRKQAEALRPYLVERLKVWQTPQDAGSPFRVKSAAENLVTS